METVGIALIFMFTAACLFTVILVLTAVVGSVVSEYTKSEVAGLVASLTFLALVASACQKLEVYYVKEKETTSQEEPSRQECECSSQT